MCTRINIINFTGRRRRRRRDAKCTLPEIIFKYALTLRDADILVRLLACAQNAFQINTRGCCRVCSCAFACVMHVCGHHKSLKPFRPAYRHKRTQTHACLASPGIGGHPIVRVLLAHIIIGSRRRRSADDATRACQEGCGRAPKVHPACVWSQTHIVHTHNHKHPSTCTQKTILKTLINIKQPPQTGPLPSS